jgi:cell division protein FtsZ
VATPPVEQPVHAAQQPVHAQQHQDGYASASEPAPAPRPAPVQQPPVQQPPRQVTFDESDDLDVPDFLK